MKTLQIVGNSTFGGATRLILDWCQYLVDHGDQVEVLSTDPRTIAALEQIPGVIFRKDIFIPREIRPVQDLRALGQLVSLLYTEKYQVVHTYSATPSFLGRLAAFLAGVPVILHHQAGWTVDEARSPLTRMVYSILEGIAASLSTRSICVSHAIMSQARTIPFLPKRKFITICNGINADPFLSVPIPDCREHLFQEYGLPPQSILVGNIGRLAPQKDNATLIRALAILKHSSPHRCFKLLLAGDGPDREALQYLARSLGLADDILFLGFQADIPYLLSCLDLFISPTLREGLSISILEAMAAARPIVVTSIPQNVELIEHEITGLLVPISSPEVLSRAILRLVTDPELASRLGKAARQRVLSDYTMERMFTETYQLYLDMVAQKARFSLSF
jgi:glycosyltransferase involved in cell wall biosynthesis